jgi:hypothetical protein
MSKNERPVWMKFSLSSYKVALVPLTKGPFWESPLILALAMLPCPLLEEPGACASLDEDGSLPPPSPLLEEPGACTSLDESRLDEDGSLPPPSSPEQERVNVMASPRAAVSAILASLFLIVNLLV